MDIAHKKTDSVLEALERKISHEYDLAYKEAVNKFNADVGRYKARESVLIDKIQLATKKSENTQKLQKDLERLRKNSLLYEKQAQARIDQLAEMMTKTNELASAYINNDMPEVYRLNYNFTNAKMEKLADNMGISYNLVNQETVKRLIADNPQLLPFTQIDIPKDLRWNKQLIRSQITQGILQGEDINKIAKRLQNVTDMNLNSAIRNARTSITSAENAGRDDRFVSDKKLLDEYGIEVVKKWLATKDERTRPTHREQSGKAANKDGIFEIVGLRYPGDPTGKPSEIYSCRCTLVEDFEV